MAPFSDRRDCSSWWRTLTNLEQRLVVLSTLLGLLTFCLIITVAVIDNRPPRTVPTSAPPVPSKDTSEISTDSTGSSTDSTGSLTGSTGSPTGSTVSSTDSTASQAGSTPTDSTEPSTVITKSTEAKIEPSPKILDPQNPDPENPDPQNPDPQNPDPENPDPQNPDPENPDPQNPDPENPDPQNPDPENPDPQNPDPENPDPQNPDPESLIKPKPHALRLKKFESPMEAEISDVHTANITSSKTDSLDLLQRMMAQHLPQQYKMITQKQITVQRENATLSRGITTEPEEKALETQKLLANNRIFKYLIRR